MKPTLLSKKSITKFLLEPTPIEAGPAAASYLFASLVVIAILWQAADKFL